MRKTLEDIAGAFGDHVVSVKEDGENIADAKLSVNEPAKHIE